MVVVDIPLIAEALVVDGEKRRIRVRERSVSSIRKRDIDRNLDVDPSYVAVPLIKIGLARGRRRRGIAGINGFPVHPQQRLDDCFVVTNKIFKVRVSDGEVSNGGFEDGVAIAAATAATRRASASAAADGETQFAALSRSALRHSAAALSGVCTGACACAFGCARVRAAAARDHNDDGRAAQDREPGSYVVLSHRLSILFDFHA